MNKNPQNTENRNRGRGSRRGNQGNWRSGRNDGRNREENDNQRRYYNNGRNGEENDNQRRNYNNGRKREEYDNQRRNYNNGKNGEDDDNRRRNFNHDNNRSANNNENRNYGGYRGMGFKMVLELLENEDLEGVLFTLSNDRKGFKSLLENHNQSPDMTVITVKLLRKVCDCTFQASKTLLLNSVIESTFIQTITLFVTTLAIQSEREKIRNKYFWKDPDDFWMSVIIICKTFYNLLPSTSCEVNLKLLKALKFNFPPIEEHHNIHISDNIKTEIGSLCDTVEISLTQVERKKEEQARGFKDEDDLEPPNDFRDINVYPSSIEITSREAIFLRRNVIKGPYQDVNHYLDVQFRLLREDFVTPLRNGICKYIENNKNKLQDIKFYHYVKILNMETVTDQNCYRIQYDFSKKKQSFQYENSKRFMFGSLLCFTADRFKTILFAKVVQRELKDLEKGQLIVGFNIDVALPENIYDLNFLMVESKVFFEPYYQVLNVLKQMSTDNFPMERYIIQVNIECKPPEYLLSIDPVYLTIEDKTLWPLAWGDHKFYGLNDSQSEAFQAALTKEFTIIQGPPGTGKTFVGLKIAKTLLENQHAWYKNTPMLIICFTNHALDQFLEGLIPTTRKLIRVGGQSKNEKVNEFNIRNRKNRQQTNHTVIQKKIEVRNYLQEIASINEFLSEIEKYDSVVEFKVFADVVDNFFDSWFGKVTNDKIIAWLLDGGQYQINNRRNVPPQQNLEAPAADVNEPLDKEDEEENLEADVNEVVDEIFQDIVVKPFKQLTSIKSLSHTLQVLAKDYYDIQISDNLSPWDKDSQLDKIGIELYKVENQLDMLKFRLKEGEDLRKNIVQPEFINMTDPRCMPPDLRWQLYFYWLSMYENGLRQKKETVTKQFRRIYTVYNEMRDMEDTQIMKSSLVVGMTTTGAARLQSSLQALKSPIVIVEEAAEVLEAHIVAALTPHCKHLILIGDHKQLKPSAAYFKIETDFLLGVSLFERMVNNQIQCHTLNIQHRMRPEIANLVRPSIYPVLTDHESVFSRPHILGVDHDLFFINHTESEQLCSDNSKKNTHEAKFMIYLARHLILNGYKPENIVILAAYLGQLFEMQREKKNHRHLLQDVRIAVLDNYQGEESDIVLLSLVRSNPEKKIGFLRTENRVCVALSRARNGFYLMGNMSQLCESSEIWPKIRETLQRQNSIGPHLTLRCQIHRHKITNVSTADDFSKFPEGGCDLLCEKSLVCGHLCKRLCHIEDRDHVNYDCQEPCEKLLCDNERHICQKYCYQECGLCSYPVERHLTCGHTVQIECHLDPETYKCIVQVDATLPCGHQTKKPCHSDPEMFRCPFPCDTRVEPCGHACSKSCHIKYDPDHLQYRCIKPCEKKRTGCTAIDPHICSNMCFQDCIECAIPVKKKRSKCDHVYKIACNTDPDDILCERPCKKILPCGHQCTQKCKEPCGNCPVKVEKIVPDCNHKVKIKCSEPPTKEKCKGKCPRPLNCGHLCGKKCKEPCETECKEIVDCFISSPCGHIITKISCFNKHNHNDKILLQMCTGKCTTQFKCTHTCSGTCGACFQFRFHQRCQEKCGVPLVCNHECPIPCREACKPCRMPCEYQCKHSKCKKLCGDPCTTCKEKCKRSCIHSKCTKRCGDICNVEPCYEPCKKKLKCGHECVGFCGDPCPKLCRIHDKEELTEILFGTEDEEDARFVLLEDCGHILESTGMENWLEQDGEEQKEIKPIVCPKCKTVIKKTARYSDYVKQCMEDLRKVKTRFYGAPKEVEDTKNALREELLMLQISGIGNNDLNEVVKKLLERVSNTKNKRKQNINKMDLDDIRMKIEVIKMIMDPFAKDNLTILNFPKSNQHISFIASFLLKNIDSITQQEVDDIMLEIDRLNRWIQFERINIKNYLHSPNIKDQHTLITGLLETPSRYNARQDSNIKNHLEALKKMTMSNISLTDVEKQEIVKAVGLTTGHWFKCPNGHPYAIGECGGAMQISKCYECGAQIGGTNHALLSTNRLATDMDGARYPAWGTQANMNDYHF